MFGTIQPDDLMKQNDSIWLTALVALAVPFMAVHAQDDLEITSAGQTESGDFELSVEGPVGELLIEWTEDLQTWIPLVPLGSTGAPVQASDTADLAAKFYRATSFPDSDDTHLSGPMAQALVSGVAYSDLQSVFGLGAGPPVSPVTTVRDLPTAGRDARLYAAVIGLLSVMATDLQATIDPSPSSSDLASAFAEDLASGSLNGRNASGQLIEIGSSGSFVPEYTQQDLLTAAASLGDELSGLRNIAFEASGGGQVSTLAPSDWNLFYWDSADWQ